MHRTFGDGTMAVGTKRDHYLLIQIDGMHCHKCEAAIQKVLKSHNGVIEVEVDFLSGQASVIYDEGSVTVNDLMHSVTAAGYGARGFSLGADAA